ncbi:MAG TPA: MauE/DoxX family redox-associated membrane protein [Candidatus Acidoferrales bacterium]|nr:MauE/DoxX family redox-associated membrane protein [Candidatus Acidoferrales bacterium]
MSRALLLAGRIGLGLVLLYAGYAKLQQPWISFAATIEAYKILPPDAVIFTARTLPWFEVVLGALLLLGVGLRWVAAVASALLLMFFAILVRSYALGMDVDCGCFGPGEKLSWKTLVRDGLLVGVSVAVTIGAFLAARRPARESTAS